MTPPPARQADAADSGWSQQAVAEPVPMHHGGSLSGQWAIQVGAYSSEDLAHAAVGIARERARAELAVAHPAIAGVHQSRGVLYRAGLDRPVA